MNDGWYGALKEAIQQQQNQLVWVSEGKVRSFLLLTHLTTHIREAFETPFSTWINRLEESGASVSRPSQFACGVMEFVGVHNLHVGLWIHFGSKGFRSFLPTELPSGSFLCLRMMWKSRAELQLYPPDRQWVWTLLPSSSGNKGLSGLGEGPQSAVLCMWDPGLVWRKRQGMGRAHCP